MQNMKKMIFHRMTLLAGCCAIVALLGACGGGNASKKAQERSVPAAAQSGVLEIDDLLAGADSLVGKTVTVEGVCTHTCKHGARKIFLMGSDDTRTIRVESGDLERFDPQCVNRVVRVTGRLDEQRVDEAYLARWEAQTQAGTAEKHGTTEAGCSTEKAARGETGNTVGERIADFRARIAARQAAEGKAYLSFYYVTAASYEIQQ